MKQLILAALCCGFIIAQGCHVTKYNDGDLLPLSLNNYWIFQSKSGNYIDSNRVTDIQMKGKRQYYYVAMYLNNSSIPLHRWLRQEANSGVVEFIDSQFVYLNRIDLEDTPSKSFNKEQIVYKFNVDTGTSWYCYLPVTPSLFIEGRPMYSMAKVTLRSVNDTISINSIRVPHCHKFEIDILSSDDEAYYEWLAPSIGFIQKRNLYYQSQKTLKDYNIN